MSDASNYRDYVTDGKIGIDLTATYASTSAGSISFMPARPGDMVRTNNGASYIFARAASDITPFSVVAFSTFADSSLSSDATRAPILQACPTLLASLAPGGAQGNAMLAISQVSIASSYYGWLARDGTALRVNAAALCNPKVPLYATATAGVIDDATVSSGYIAGITLNTSATSASAAWCTASWPKVVHAQVSST